MIIQGENSIKKNQFVDKMNYAYNVIEFTIVNNEIKIQNFIRLNNFVNKCLLNQTMHFADNTYDAFNCFKCF